MSGPQPIKLTFLGIHLVCRIEFDIRLIICPLFAETVNTTVDGIECQIEFYIRLNLFLPAATKLGHGNVLTGVCDSVNRVGSTSVHAGIPPPPLQEQTHPNPRTRHPLPLEQTPAANTPPQEQTPSWSRHHPPGTRHPPGNRPPPGADTPQGRHPGTRSPGKQTLGYGQRAAGTHPTGMHSC